MNCPPLAIVQARIGSTRLQRKMLLPLAGRPLVWHAWYAAVTAFGARHTVVAMPASQQNDELADVIGTFPESQIFRWDGPEDDVLGRFHACAHQYRWHPDSVIVRVTPDDPRKSPLMMRRVADGERLPVELGAEAFTLDMLDVADARLEDVGYLRDVVHPNPREHITDALFPTSPPPPPPGIWTVDTQGDFDAMRKVMEQ